MSHELFRLTEKLAGKQLLVTPEYFEKVISILEDRNGGRYLSPTTQKLERRNREVSYYADRKLGVIDIHGGITDVPYYELCGGESASHEMIRQEVEQLIEKGAKTIVLDQDSNGGMAHMAFESSAYIRNLADEHGVKLISYTSGSSFSASYNYSAVAHEVIVNPSAEVGSIGVRALLRNTNGYFKSLGIEDIHITAGEGKVPFDSEGKFTEEYIKEVQEGVLETYETFISHVAMWRGMTVEAVKQLGAKTYTSQKALKNGLVDKVMTLEEFRNYLDEINPVGEEMSTTTPVKNLLNKTKDNKEMSVDVQKFAELEASLKAVMGEFETAKKSLSQKDSELSAALQKLSEIEKEKEAIKINSRKEKLISAVGEKEAESLSKSMSSLSDEDFNAVLNVLSKSADRFDNTEQGSSHTTEASDVDYDEVFLAEYNKVNK